MGRQPGGRQGTPAKIEAQIRVATDVELFVLAGVFQIGIEELFPPGFGMRLRRDGWALG